MVKECHVVIPVRFLLIIVLTWQVMTTRIAGGLISPKRALLLAPLKGLLYNFS